ncbi:hypothetical protein ACKKBF_B36865 [Auxenochlorella protothecoides x Auxenochlorella symbiontica]
MSRYKSLELFKFGVYVTIPVLLVGAIVYRPENLEAIIRNRSYVVYPPEAPRPPSAEQLQELLKKQK